MYTMYKRILVEFRPVMKISLIRFRTTICFCCYKPRRRLLSTLTFVYTEYRKRSKHM